MSTISLELVYKLPFFQAAKSKRYIGVFYQYRRKREYTECC